MNNAMTSHSDAELLAAFVDGQLDPEQLQEVTAHLASCEECRGVIGEAVAFQQEEAPPARRTAWWAVAAAIVVVAGLAYPAFDLYKQREIAKDQQSLFAAWARDQRPIEGRFSGQASYAEHHNMRGSEQGDTTVAIPTEVEGPAYDVLRQTEGNDSPLAIRANAAANATLKDQQASDILATLQKIPASARDANTWNDIAALAAAAGNNALALDAVQQALHKQPGMPEALFNRAVILRTAAAWNDYLAVDSQSSWADEARKNKIRDIQ